MNEGKRVWVDGIGWFDSREVLTSLDDRVTRSHAVPEKPADVEKALPGKHKIPTLNESAFREQVVAGVSEYYERRSEMENDPKWHTNDETVKEGRRKAAALAQAAELTGAKLDPNWDKSS